MIKRILPLIIFLVVFLPLVYADFDVSIPESTLAIQGRATIPITITNNQIFEDTYMISALDFNWLVESLDEATVPQGQIKTINMKLKASQTLETKNYGIKIRIKSSANKQIEKIAKIVVPQPNNVFGISVLGPEALDPRKDVNKLTLEFENYYDNDFSNLTLILESSAFKETKEIQLGPRKIIQEEFNLKLPADTQEGDHLTNVLFYQNGELVANQTVTLKISLYQGVRDIVSEENSLLVKKEYVKKVNDGNAIAFQKYVKTITFLQKLFTSTDPVPDSIDKSNGNYVLSWDIRLEPGEEKEITIKTNFRTPVIFSILFIILLVLLYLRYKKDIVVTKKALISGSAHGLSRLKVNITLYNKGKKEITNIKLMERVPGTHEDPSEFTTLKPFKISKWSTGINMIWKIDSLAPKQEKIVEYKIGARMHANKLVLPSTLAQYVQGKNTVISKSKSMKLRK